MHKNELGSAIKGLYIRWAIYGLLFGLLPGLHVDNAAHIGGLAAGFGMAWLTGTPKLIDTPAERVWTVLSWLCLALTAYSFVNMYLFYAAVSR
jgi:membrane associated rhomboid family serine protease